MPQTFNENPITEISCITMFSGRTDKTGCLKHYSTFIYYSSEGLSHSIINDSDLPCKIICFVGDSLTEPTEEAVAVCSGSIGYFGPQKGLQLTLQDKIE